MARTRQTARKSTGGESPRLRLYSSDGSYWGESSDDESYDSSYCNESSEDSNSESYVRVYDPI